jgi:HAD superfamily phosphoserine phosphatase-like hydrolase
LYQKSKIAFFDLDGTLTEKAENTGIKLEKVLYEENILNEEYWKLTLEVIEKYRRNKISYNELVQDLSQIYANGLKGVPISQVKNVLPEVIKSIKFREEVPEVLQWFKENKFRIILISASPNEIVSFIASKLGFHESYGLQVEIKDGKYTGKLLEPVTIDYKRNIIINRLKQSRCCFSVGIGDTLEDMEAYRCLNMRFLIDDNHVNHKGFNDPKILLVKDLREIITLIFYFDLKTFKQALIQKVA